MVLPITLLIISLCNLSVVCIRDFFFVGGVGCDRMFIRSCLIWFVQRNIVYGVYVQMNVPRVVNSLMLT